MFGFAKNKETRPTSSPSFLTSSVVWLYYTSIIHNHFYPSPKKPTRNTNIFRKEANTKTQLTNLKTPKTQSISNKTQLLPQEILNSNNLQTTFPNIQTQPTNRKRLRLRRRPWLRSLHAIAAGAPGRSRPRPGFGEDEMRCVATTRAAPFLKQNVFCFFSVTFC